MTLFPFPSLFLRSELEPSACHDKLEENAMDCRPKLIICRGSAYPNPWDYAGFRSIVDKGTLPNDGMAILGTSMEFSPHPRVYKYGLGKSELPLKS